MFYLQKKDGIVVWKTYSADNAKRVSIIHSDLEVFESDEEIDVPQHGKVSVLRVLCALFSDPQASYSVAELKKAVPGANWPAIITALSDMKNPKYNKGEIIHVRKRKGRYVRE